MQQSSLGLRHALWLALLVAASVVFTLGFACALPFAAFGAAAAMTLNVRDALLLSFAAWLTNQIVGFTSLGYPWDTDTFTWGIVLGAVAILATLAAQLAVRQLGGRGAVAVALASFAAAFVAYEGALFLVSALWLGGIEDITAEIVVRILEINAAAFAGLLVLHRLAIAGGLVAAPALRPAGGLHA
jgi:hypothetical protein